MALNITDRGPGFGQGIEPTRARGQAALRECAELANVEGTQAPPAQIAPMLKEIFYQIILGGMHAALGEHAKAAKHLKEAAHQLTLAIARAQQLAERERLPRK